jgi:hypothetical protein
MARRKSHSKKRHHTKRRRHSAMHGIGGSLMSAAYIAGGAVLATVINQKLVQPMLTKASPSMSANTTNIITGAVPIALGILTPKVVKGATGANLGSGMIAAGAINLVKATGIISGMKMGDYYYGNKPVRNIAGYQGASAGTYIAGIKNAAIMEAC